MKHVQEEPIGEDLAEALSSRFKACNHHGVIDGEDIFTLLEVVCVELG